MDSASLFYFRRLWSVDCVEFSHLYLSFYFLHNSYYQIKLINQALEMQMKGIKYSHPKKDRLDMITKFGWCCDGLVVASGVVLVCFCYYCCAAIARPLPSLRSHLVVSQVLFCFFFLASCFAPPSPLVFFSFIICMFCHVVRCVWVSSYYQVSQISLAS